MFRHCYCHVCNHYYANDEKLLFNAAYIQKLDGDLDTAGR